MCDPGPMPATLVGPRSRGENAWARGRRRYCADKRGRVVRRLARCGCVRRVMADERARLVSGCARAGGDTGLALWAMREWEGRLARKAEQVWVAAAPSFSFSFSVCFSFLSFALIQI